MSATTKRVLFWTPRALCILFAMFISTFALDVFRDSEGLLVTSIALLMHLVPTLLIIGVLLIAWRQEWIGAIAFGGLAWIYLAKSPNLHTLWDYAAIPAPLIALSVLFLINWKYHAALRDFSRTP